MNGWNNLSNDSRGMPMPVSRTSKCSSARPFWRPSKRHFQHDFAGLRELDRVADQVEQTLTDALRIAEHALRHFRAAR